ncbi:MAG: hypothetical protein KJP04_11430, partial [Arenicella sp.]|nr:hypothetical protein [Arenicella sp.]
MNQSKSNNTFSANAAPLAAGEVIPPPRPEPFMGAISHPDLYLWDVWSAQQDGDIHLYCLAVSRTDVNGNVFPPADRNLARFHIRHFLSVDAGRSWQDRGCFQQPRVGHNTFDSRTI